MIRIFIIAILCALAVTQVDPPTWPDHFTQVFVESYGNSAARISGSHYYDATRNMSRVDRTDGKFEGICGSNQPNISTYCTQLVRDGKRYVIFPEKRICCLCCDAAHGCGILRKDWLKESTYVGEEAISG